MNYLELYFASKKWIEKQKLVKGLKEALIIIGKMKTSPPEIGFKNRAIRELKKEVKK